MPSRNRLINALLKRLPSLLPKRFSGDGKAKDKKKCHADASIIPAKKRVLKKGRKIGSVDSDGLSYHIISGKGYDEKRYCSIHVYNQTEACVNRMVFDMRTAWQITLLLLGAVNENPPEDDNRWMGKEKRKTESQEEHKDE